MNNVVGRWGKGRPSNPGNVAGGFLALAKLVFSFRNHHERYRRLQNFCFGLQFTARLKFVEPETSSEIF